MKAIVLAAGKGTRMQSLTTDVPKPMLTIGHYPILEYIVRGLAKCGIDQVFIVTGYKAELIENYFGTGDKFGVRISYARQVVQDGTGKAPELAREFVGDSPFLLTYGDILVRPETYKLLIRTFSERTPTGALAVTRSEDIQKGGLCIFNEEFTLKDLIEKPSITDLEKLRSLGLIKPHPPYWYNAGIYIFTPALFTFTATLQKSPRGEYELTDAIKGMVHAGHKIIGVEVYGEWYDVRDPSVLANLRENPPRFLSELTGG